MWLMGIIYRCLTGQRKHDKWVSESAALAGAGDYRGRTGCTEPSDFVMTHNQPKDTSYGAEDWGDIGLGGVFERHPNVVNFSGHVHYSLLDERSIWQGKYTVINTQSLSYTELEPGKENGTIPPNAEDTPMGYLMTFGEHAIQLHRLNFQTMARIRRKNGSPLGTAAALRK